MRIFENYFIKAIEHVSLFTEPHLNTRRAGKILESYANPTLLFNALKNWALKVQDNSILGDGKTVTEVLKMLPKAAGPRSQFFTIRIDPKPLNNAFIFFSCGKLVQKWVCLRTFVIGSAYAPFLIQTICNKKMQQASNSDTRQKKMY